LPRISVIVCSHNGERYIGAALEALEAQSLARELYEVIVVDDGSTDRTAEVAGSIGVRVKRLPRNLGVGAARNAGVKIARAPIVAFTDDDCRPDREWLQELLKTFDSKDVDAVAGLPIPAGETGLLLDYLALHNPLAPVPVGTLRSRGPVERLKSYVVGGIVGTDLPDGAPLYSAATANLAFHRWIIERVGGFDPSFTGAEDEDLCRRAHELRQPLHLVYSPRAAVYHDFRGGLCGVMRRSFSYGESTTRMAAKHDAVKPIIFPGPFLVLGAAGAAVLVRRKLMRVAAAVTPFAGYPWWILHAWRCRRPVLIALALLQASEEACAMAGQLHRRGR